MRLNKLGVWAATDSFSAAGAAAFAKRVEALGYGALWTPEAVWREVFSAAAWVLANTSSLIVASGIANIYARDALGSARICAEDRPRRAWAQDDRAFRRAGGRRPLVQRHTG